MSRVQTASTLSGSPIRPRIRGVLFSDRPISYGVWVDPAARGCGYGRRLIDWLIGWARSHGQRVFRLEVAEGNMAAIALYERIGFTWTGARRPMLSNAQTSEAEMLLALDADEG